MAISIKKIEQWAAKKKTAKLLKALTVDALDIRIEVIRALGTIQDESVMHSLISLLNDPNASIRASAAEALGVIGNARSLEFVRQLWMNEQDDIVREKARLAIVKIKATAIQLEKQ